VMNMRQPPFQNLQFLEKYLLQNVFNFTHGYKAKCLCFGRSIGTKYCNFLINTGTQSHVPTHILKYPKCCTNLASAWQIHVQLICPFFFFFFNRHYNPQLGFDRLNCCWTFSAGRFYRVPLPAAHLTPNLEENQGFRAFQLSPQEAPSIWSDTSEPSSGRWNYGPEMAEKFCRKWRLPRHFWVLLHAVKHDMGQTALLPLQTKECWGLFCPKNPTASAGFEPANLGTKGQHATSRPPKLLTRAHTHPKISEMLYKFSLSMTNSCSADLSIGCHNYRVSQQEGEI
jgi:hypothetical protein